MYNLSVQYSPSYLLIVISGTARIAEFCASAGFLAELARRLSYRRVLMDMLAVDMLLEPQDAHVLSSHLDQWLPYVTQLAYVAPEGASPGILEAVCRLRGVECERFGTLAQADEWLRDGSR